MLGREGYGRSIDFFTDVAIKDKTAEPDDNIKFESSDFPKGVLDTTLKSRENEMKVKDFETEIFKCDPCSKSKKSGRQNSEL